MRVLIGFSADAIAGFLVASSSAVAEVIVTCSPIPLAFYRPMISVFLPIIADRGVYIREFWGLLFYCYFGLFSVLSFSLEQTRILVVSTFAPRWLHRGISMVFLHQSRSTVPSRPLCPFSVPFDYSNFFAVSTVSM